MEDCFGCFVLTCTFTLVFWFCIFFFDFFGPSVRHLPSVTLCFTGICLLSRNALYGDDVTTIDGGRFVADSWPVASLVTVDSVKAIDVSRFVANSSPAEAEDIYIVHKCNNSSKVWSCEECKAYNSINPSQMTYHWLCITISNKSNMTI